MLEHPLEIREGFGPEIVVDSKERPTSFPGLGKSTDPENEVTKQRSGPTVWWLMFFPQETDNFRKSERVLSQSKSF